MKRQEFVKNIPRPKADLRKGVRVRWHSFHPTRLGNFVTFVENKGEATIVEVLPEKAFYTDGACEYRTMFRVKDNDGNSLIKSENELERL